jgi:DNA-binding response OmpR family regulator
MNGEEIDLSYEFGPFRLEPATRRLLREGEALPLTPKAFDTLLLLVQNRERVMEKEEVLRRIWPDAVRRASPAVVRPRGQDGSGRPGRAAPAAEVEPRKDSAHEK